MRKTTKTALQLSDIIQPWTLKVRLTPDQLFQIRRYRHVRKVCNSSQSVECLSVTGIHEEHWNIHRIASDHNREAPGSGADFAGPISNEISHAKFLVAI
jgi:hypothetical protein